MTKKIKKTVIVTGYSCNNRCGFCYNIHKRGLPDRATGEIIKEIADARNRGSNYLEIIGGEETIRADIIDIVKFAEKLGFETIAMATNGRMFSNADFARQITAAGLNHVIFSMHGHNAKLHDGLTDVKGSFGQLLEGIRNTQGLAVQIGSNTTIVKQNYKFLADIGNLLYKLGIRNAEFIFVDPSRGGAYEHFDEFVPRVSEAAAFIRKCLDIGKNKGIIHWHIRYVPLCYFLDYRDQISELNEVKKFDSEHVAQDFRNTNVELSRKEVGRIRPKKCRGCAEYNNCEGLWKEYYKHYGDKELRPVK